EFRIDRRLVQRYAGGFHGLLLRRNAALIFSVESNGPEKRQGQLRLYVHRPTRVSARRIAAYAGTSRWGSTCRVVSLYRQAQKAFSRLANCRIPPWVF